MGLFNYQENYYRIYSKLNNSRTIMVFCKLSKDLKTKLESSEKSLEESVKTAQKVVNQHIQNSLNAIEEKKKSFSDQISKKIEEKKKNIELTIIQPYIEKKKNNYALMFIVDICLSTVSVLFLYKMYPFIKKYITKENYTPEQYEKAKQLPETAYSKEELRVVKEFRQSYQNWIDYYKQDNAFSDDNIGLNEIRRGSALRQPFLFIIQYVIPYIIVAYIVWFIVKYIKYVLAAIWGFFVAMYQFVTLKITCTLAEKWYIRLVTGWSRCNPNWSEYVNNWQNTYISRPIAEERIGYLRGVQEAKTAYIYKYGDTPPWKLGFSFFTFDWFSSFWDWLRELKKIYIDLPIQELYLQIIDFHPTYVVYPYEIVASEGDKKINKIAGNTYPSKTKSGKVCKCPPKKTVFKKLNQFIQKAPSVDQMKSVVSNATNSMKNLKTSVSNSITNSSISNKIKDISITVPSCDTVEKTSKSIAKGLWTTMMLFTTGVVVYSLLYSTPTFLSNIISPVYNFANSYTATASLPIYGIIILTTYLTVFAGLGFYGFIH